MNNTKISGIILAAGLSGRMNSFKPLLKTKDGNTFIQTIIKKLSTVCEEIIVVCGHKNDEVITNISNMPEYSKCRVVINDDYKKGMFSSLKCGVEHVNEEWILYHFVDQPGLPTEFYSEMKLLINEKYNWIQPKKANRKGHPILFDGVVKNAIRIGDENSNLRIINKDSKISKLYFESSSDLIFQDIDTENDYRMIDSNNENELG